MLTKRAVSLPLGIAILALAVLLGGLAALFRGRAERAMPPIRTFAVLAAASIALLHLLPEAIEGVGWGALLAALGGFLAPAALERAFPARAGHHRHEDAPTTALAMGYAAVLAHQLGEGAAVATLARSGALSASVVLAIAAHTVPLAMVVAIGVLEAKGKDGRATRATFLALAGVALATAGGAFLGNVAGGTRWSMVEPWALATVAGLLLHALAHDARPSPLTSTTARVVDASAGFAGLIVAAIGIEESDWVQAITPPVRVALGCLAFALMMARSFLARPRAATAAHEH